MLLAMVEDMLAAEPDLIVVGRSAAGEDSLSTARHQRADVLLAHEGGDPGACLAALLAEPPLSILSIGRDGKTAAAVSLARQPVPLEGNGSAPFAAAIRRAHSEASAPPAPVAAPSPSFKQER